MSTRVSVQPKRKNEPAVVPLDEGNSSGRWAFTIDGYIQYAGPREECQRRMRLRTLPDERPRQDHMLKRAVQ